MRLLTKSIYQDHAYDIKGQEHADLRIYRTFKSNWNTICLPVSLTNEQVKKTFGDNTVVAEFIGVTKAASDDGNILRFKTTTNGIEAGVPYIIMLQDSYGTNVSLTAPNAEETYQSSYFDEYVSDKTNGYYLIEDIDLPSSDQLPELKKVTHDHYTFVGNYNSMNISESNKVLYISNNAFRYKDAGTVTNSTGYRAYFVVDNQISESGLSKAMTFSFDETTGIISCQQNAGNGRQAVYDLMGRLVGDSTQALPAGIYIKGGKKMVVK